MPCCGFFAVVLVGLEAVVSAGSSHSHGLPAVTPTSESLIPLPFAGSTCLAQGPVRNTSIQRQVERLETRIL